MRPEDCAAQHFGAWMVEPRWMASAIAAVNAGTWKPESPAMAARGELEDEDDGFAVLQGGVAVVPLRGHLTKGRSSFGGTSTVETRRAIRLAAADRKVAGIMLLVESPGGAAAGTAELAAEVARAREEKPIWAHIQDIGASAAYWPAVEAERVTANAAAEVGSVGGMSVLVDSSEASEKAGLKFHVVSTGALKGAGFPGTPITKEHIEVSQELIDDLTAPFFAAVSARRGLTGAALSNVTTGRIWVGARAKNVGLVDEIMSWESAVSTFVDHLGRRQEARDRRSRIRRAQLEA